MMSVPLWSFVIAYYNEADYLPRTLESLIGQTAASAPTGAGR